MRQIAGGMFHSLALLGDGNVVSVGINTYGQLGHGNKEDCVEPKVIAALAGRNVFRTFFGSFVATRE